MTLRGCAKSAATPRRVSFAPDVDIDKFCYGSRFLMCAIVDTGGCSPVDLKCGSIWNRCPRRKVGCGIEVGI